MNASIVVSTVIHIFSLLMMALAVFSSTKPMPIAWFFLGVSSVSIVYNVIIMKMYVKKTFKEDIFP